ncbi:MAG TPA: putative DNA-binding domain-containing protein [Polyangiaceae bacterium]|nr:putative DNA-binding domain-containing protein [Polyangiaceae bacterium]
MSGGAEAGADEGLAQQRALRELCLRAEVRPADLEALGGEPERWLVYRRMVRARLREAVGHGFERLEARVGAEIFGAWFEAFLARQPPRSPYLRESAGEFGAFLEGYERPGDPHPALTLDLARFEWAELDCAYEARPTPEARPLSMEARPALSPALRVLRLAWAAHRLGRDEPRAEVAEGPVWVCVYRDSESFDVRVLELTEVAGRLLGAMARADRPLVELVRGAAAEAGATLDGAWLAALSDVLADFSQRGLLVGSLPEGPAGAGR